MMLPLVVVGCTSKQSARRAATIASGVDNAASPRLADTAERDYFTSQRGWSLLCKNNWKEPSKHINELVEIELPISMGNLA